MCTNCGQTVTPTTDETALPCNEFISDKCLIHEAAIAYLNLEPNTPYDVLLEALLQSLSDARNRIDILEEGTSPVQTKSVKVINSTEYTLTLEDAGNILWFEEVPDVVSILTIPTHEEVPFPIGTEIIVGASEDSKVLFADDNVDTMGPGSVYGDTRTFIKIKEDFWIIKWS